MDACQRTIAYSNRAKKLCITSALSICVFLSTAVNAQTIRIGLSGPFTGGSSPMGESMRNSVRLAADEINSSGGINGFPIELTERDDIANNEIGAKIADELATMDIQMVILGTGQKKYENLFEKIWDNINFQTIRQGIFFSISIQFKRRKVK